MTRTPLSLSKLEDQSRRIQEAAHHIGDYRLKDINTLLSDTVRIASDTNLELRAQFEAWTNIKKSATTDAQAYVNLQQKLATTNQLQAQEIDRLHEVLTLAEKPTFLYSVMTIIFSFLVGIVTALAADSLKGKLHLIIRSIFLSIKREPTQHG